MTPLPDQEKTELRALSHLVQNAAPTKSLVDSVGICEDDFTSDARRDAFRLLLADSNDDLAYRLVETRKALPQLTEDAFVDYFLGLAPSPSALPDDFRELVASTCKREIASEISNIMARRMEPEILNDAMNAARTQAMERYEHRRNLLSTLTLGSPSPALRPDLPRRSLGEGGALDPSLLSVPGFVNELADYTMRTAPRPNRVLAFAGALTMLAHLAGRKFYGPGDAFPNLYMIALAESAVGKDHPRKVAKLIADEAHISGSVIQNIASGQALEDALLRMPTLLCQFDEFDSVLRELKNDRNTSPSMESLWRTLLSVFTSSASTITTRLRAAGQNKPVGGEEIRHPSFTVFATAIPDNFYGALSMRALTGGLFGRFLVVEAGERGARNPNSGLQDHPLPYFLMQKVSYLASLPPHAMDRLSPPPRKVDYADDEARAAVDRVAEAADALYTGENAGEMERSLWGRTVEHVLKLSLLYALSCNLESPAITAEAVEWAWRFVECIQSRMMRMAGDYVAVDEMDELMLGALRRIRDAGRDGISHSNLLKCMHVTSFKMSEIAKTLEERGDIVVDTPPTSTKRGRRYRIRERGRK